MEKIKIENLTFTYPDRKTPALKNISLEIAPGEFVTVFGKSGCGKSTLLRHLKPELTPFGMTKGKVFLGSNSIGFVMQNPDAQIVCDKVWHELAFGLESMGCKNSEIRTRVAEMASFFGIQNWYYKNTAELSGGQKQLLNLASVMVMQPDVLVLDEPCGQLDPLLAHDFLNMVSRINKELGTTVILSEHRLENAIPLSDRLIVMDNGAVTVSGDAKLVGAELKRTGSDMLLALPAPMRAYYSKDNSYSVPLSVRDGREWLLKMPVNADAVFEKKEAKSKETMLDVRDIYFRYEKSLPDVLSGVSFKVHRGEIYAILGSNGVGKTTVISAISGALKPYSGKIKSDKKILVLPQNPKNLFVKKTVYEDLLEVSKDEKKLLEIINICEIGHLIGFHPYDLSGGEQQRAALAKVLLSEGEILLLDEPTKGLDAHFKEKLAKVLAALTAGGVSIVMVSHDIEFCAKYADRAGLFFGGEIIAEDTPREFFAKKNFYTTSANRMARELRPDAVLTEDIISMLGGDEPTFSEDTHICVPLPKKSDEKPKKKLRRRNIIFGAVFLISFIICCIKSNGDFMLQLASIACLGGALYNLIGKSNIQKTEITRNTPKKRTVAASAVILLFIPVTMYFGITYLDVTQYNFLGIIIIAQTIVPFIPVFEGRRADAKELVLISVLCAIAVAGRVFFAAVPQFKPTLALVIISGICLGGEAGFMIGAVCAFVSNFYFSQGAWTPWQMFAMGIIGFLSGVVLCKNKISVCIFGFFSTLLVYGAIMNTATLLIGRQVLTKSLIINTFALGLPMDLVHAVSTVFFLWFATEPMCNIITRIKIKYGI